MGVLGSLGRIIIGGVLGGPAGAISVFTVEHGDEVLDGTIDVANQIVQIGEDIYRAIPPEAFFLAGDPIHGLLKHEFENEIILIGRIGVDVGLFTGLTWPLLGPVGMTADILKGVLPTFVNEGLLNGRLAHRLLNDQEWEMAQYIFHNTLFARSDIILTDMGGIDGRPFVLPTGVGEQALVNPKQYARRDHSEWSGPVPELTRVAGETQAPDGDLPLRRPRRSRTGPTTSSRARSGTKQPRAAGQHRRSVGAGSTRKANDVFDAPSRGKLSIGSPMFHYINRNIRRKDTEGRPATAARAATAQGRRSPAHEPDAFETADSLVERFGAMTRKGRCHGHLEISLPARVPRREPPELSCGAG